MEKLIHKVRDRNVLWKSWHHVKNSASKSKSTDTRKAAKQFQKNAVRRIEKIQEQLREGKFSFKGGQAKLISKGKGGGKKRGIVCYPIDVRVVQRALLEVLGKTKFVKTIESIATSFGSVSRGEEQKGGCDDAIRFIKERISASKKCYYIKSDIKTFFTQIPRKEVLAKLSKLVDEHFLSLLDEASKSEVVNFDAIPNDFLSLFPWEDKGVPQGLSLSPLFGNILLEDFDRKFNTENVCCVRYVDDLLFLGADPKETRGVFSSAKRYLRSNGLDCYAPGDSSEKASEDWVDKGFEYLGYEIRRGLVRPTKKNQGELISKIREQVWKAKRALPNGTRHSEKAGALHVALGHISKILSSWRGAFGEADDRVVMGNLDNKVMKLVEDYFATALFHLERYKKKSDQEGYRRVIGIPTLSIQPNLKAASK